MMYQHHQSAIGKLTQTFCNDPAFPAIIVTGSVAKGREREDSDIDVVMIATDSEYARRIEDNAIHYYSADFCDYPGVYIDGKIITYDFLEEVETMGSEVARSAFIGAFIAYSRIEGLETALKRIVAYPREERKEKIESFVAQFRAAKWYMEEAERRDDRYLLLRSATNLVLFGIRIILAHNEMLYSYHKYLMADLKNAPSKPEGAMDLAQALVMDPSVPTAQLFFDCIMGYEDWPEPAEGWAARFIRDTEYNWRTGIAPIEDR